MNSLIVEYLDRIEAEDRVRPCRTSSRAPRTSRSATSPSTSTMTETTTTTASLRRGGLKEFSPSLLLLLLPPLHRPSSSLVAPPPLLLSRLPDDPGRVEQRAARPSRTVHPPEPDEAVHPEELVRRPPVRDRWSDEFGPP